MKTETPASDIQPPAELVTTVRNLRRWLPFRAVCWGAFKPSDPSDTLSGAHHTKHAFNKALRAGYVGFTL